MLAKQALSQLPISGEAAAQINAMLSAAANPDAENPAVILRTFEQERQEAAAQLQQALGATFADVAKRGKRALLDIPNEEWDALMQSEDNADES